ncbi:MAG: exo-alpha-sialidase [Bacteroidota bacterium]
MNIPFFLVIIFALSFFEAEAQNFRIYPSNVTQTETFIARHPTNPDILFATANTINLNTGFISEGIYVSTDAGVHWSGSDTCKGSPIGFHKGDPGITIDKNGTFILIRLGFSPGLYSHFSTDFGQSWSYQKRIAANDQDRATLTSDIFPASANYGRTYTAWVRFSPPYPMMFSYSDDGGLHWSDSVQINAPNQRNQGGELAMSANGTVNVCWVGVQSSSPFTEDFVGFASSTNGGTNWFKKENAFDINGIAGTLSQKSNIRVNGLPRIDIDKSGGVRNGWIYIVSAQKNLSPAGSDPDIILHRSSDNGISWSEGIRVNQDAVNNAKIQYFPVVHIDFNGGINVLYYDDRNTTSDSTGVFLSRSIDGGNSWSDFEITDHNFKPQSIGGLGQGYQGDNIGLTSSGNMLFPIWMDNSSGIYQLWMTRVDITMLEFSEQRNAQKNKYVLLQNYPNPFNPATTIRFTMHESRITTLKVYDLLGKEVAILLNNESMQAGTHEVQFDGNKLSSGIYFYRLNVDGKFSEAKKLILMK